MAVEFLDAIENIKTNFKDGQDIFGRQSVRLLLLRIKQLEGLLSERANNSNLKYCEHNIPYDTVCPRCGDQIEE